jgi:hypothetical protein
VIPSVAESANRLTRSIASNLELDGTAAAPTLKAGASEHKNAYPTKRPHQGQQFKADFAKKAKIFVDLCIL